jgi:hypothetical protein
VSTGVAVAAVEQRMAEMRFEIGHGLADHRLGAMQLPAGRGKAAGIGSGDEGSQLVDGDPVEHISIKRWITSKYIGYYV